MFGKGIRPQTFFPIPLPIIPLPNGFSRSSVGLTAADSGYGGSSGKRNRHRAHLVLRMGVGPIQRGWAARDAPPGDRVRRRYASAFAKAADKLAGQDGRGPPRQ